MFLEYRSIRRSSGGPQKPSSWLSEGVGCVFTVSTESSEIVRVLYLLILGAIPHVLVGSWCKLLARETMQRVQRYREQAEQALLLECQPSREAPADQHPSLSVALLALFVGNQVGKD